MEENNKKNCFPKMPEEEPDDWAVAVLTAGFAGIGINEYLGHKSASSILSDYTRCQ